MPMAGSTREAAGPADGGASFLVMAMLGEKVPAREREAALRQLAAMLRLQPPAAGHVGLVEEIFLRYILIPQRNAAERRPPAPAPAQSPQPPPAAGDLGSTEEVRGAVLAAVDALYESAARAPRGSATPSLTGLSALVLQTLLQSLPAERSPQLRCAALRCVRRVWEACDPEGLSGFLPGTAAGLVAVLETPRLGSEATALACECLARAVVSVCADAANEAALGEADGARPGGGGTTLADLRRAAAAAATAGGTGGGAAAVELLTFSAESRRGAPPAAAPERGPPGDRDAEAVARRRRDAEWVRELRERLPKALSRVLAPVRALCGRGTVVAEVTDAGTAARAALARAVAESCSRVLRPAVPELLEAELIGIAAAAVPPAGHRAEAARELALGCGMGAGPALRERLRELGASAGRSAGDCVALGGWIGTVLRADAAVELDTVDPDFVTLLLRQATRLVATAAGGSPLRALSRQPGSVLAAAGALVAPLATWLPLGAVLEPLLADMMDFARWRTHHAVAWLLGGALAAAGGSEVSSADGVCDAALAVIDELTATPEFWYFDPSGQPGAVGHRVELCRLLVSALGDAAAGVFTRAQRGGLSDSRGDRFLLATVFPLLEKAADGRWGELQVDARDVLCFVAERSGAPGDTRQQRAARLIFQSFDWIVDAVVSRLPYVDDYPATPGVLAAALGMLSGMLGADGAPRELLVLLDHVLRHVAGELMSVRPGKATRLQVLSLTADVAGALAHSVRRKQAQVLLARRAERAAAAVLIAVAGATAGWAAAGSPAGEREEGGGAVNDEEPCSEESWAVAGERRLLGVVLEKLRHHLTTPDVGSHGSLCRAVKHCLIGFACYDGVSDRLQAGRRFDNPLPEIACGEVVDPVGAWLALPESDPRAGHPWELPRFSGGLCSKILHFIHLAWAPLIARLLPPGFSTPAELTKCMTPAHRKHLSAVGVRVRLRKWTVPTVDLGACGLHVADCAAHLLAYGRDFVEDRVRSELWPLLRHHLVASPHVFHECAGASKQYMATTAAARFQKAVLRLLRLLFTPVLVDRAREALRDPQLHRFSPDRSEALLPLLRDVSDATERFHDPRQPPGLRQQAEALRQQMLAAAEAAGVQLAPTQGGGAVRHSDTQPPDDG